MRAVSANPQPLLPGVEHLQAVLDALFDAVITINREFVITSFNRAAEELTGRPRDEVIGQRCFDVLRTEDCCTQDRCPLTLVLKTGRELETREVVIPVQGDGQTRVEIMFRPVRGPDGDILGGVETLRTARATAESPPTTEPPPGLTFLEAMERRAIEEVLQRTGWNRTVASRELGISRITLWRKMRRLGIRPMR